MQLRGTITKVRFYAPASGYAVIVVRGSDGELHTCVGNMAAPLEGMTVRAEATAVRDARYGPQYRLAQTLLERPTLSEELARYLGSGAFEGIGKSLAKRLLDAFGEEVFEVLEKRPDLLMGVRGISADRAMQMHASFRAARPMHEIMLHLHTLGLGLQLARRVFETLRHRHPNVAAAVRYNPYALADVPGIGFVRADEAARRQGLAADAPPRMLAGLLHVMRIRAQEGHTQMGSGALAHAAAKLLRVPATSCPEYIDELIASGALRAEQLPHGERVLALPELQAAEKAIAQGLAVLTGGAPIASGAINVTALVARAGVSVPPSQDQRDAIAQALSHPVAILTGGPGTGKTTTTRLYLQAVEDCGLSAVLVAPTARAALQLAQATQRPAGTIHRLLGLFGNQRERPAKNRILDVAAVVCDETSMVGGGLAARLIGALRADARLLLVGDADQLESIEWGNVLGDLIASGVIPTARLTELHRTGAGSGIARAARDVLNGAMPSAAADFSFVEIDRPEDVADYIVQEALTRFRAAGRFDAVQVLTPLRQRGPLSSDALNRALQFQLFRGSGGLQVGPRMLHPGDKVLQTRNNYRLGIVNGDIGEIVQVDQRQRSILVDFQGSLVAIAREALYAIDLAYGMSVHKSQGGQFPRVIMPVHSSNAFMLTRNLVYTGMTRAASDLKLVGDRRGIEQAIMNRRQLRRETALMRYVRELLVAKAGPRSLRRLNLFRA